MTFEAGQEVWYITSPVKDRTHREAVMKLLIELGYEE